MIKKILVTGGLGFIGRHTLKPLLENNYEVHVITSRKAVSPTSEIHLHQADLLDCGSHAGLIEKIRPDYLLHTAWYTKNGKFWNAVENTYWLAATISLAKSFYSHGGRRLLALGTCAEYDWSGGPCIEGETPELPASHYGRFKKTTFEALDLVAKHYQGSFAWGRVFFPYGPGEAEERLIPYVIRSLLLNETAKCTQGSQVRDFIYVEDLAQALIRILDSNVEGVVNLGTGASVAIRDLVYQVADLLNKRELISLGAISEPIKSPPSIVASVKRLNNDLGWTPQFSLDAGLRKTVEWWSQQLKTS